MINMEEKFIEGEFLHLEIFKFVIDGKDIYILMMVINGKPEFWIFPIKNTQNGIIQACKRLLLIE